jgi:hypothetical protein
MPTHVIITPELVDELKDLCERVSPDKANSNFLALEEMAKEKTNTPASEFKMLLASLRDAVYFGY